ncbi:hypothetical protein QR98_0021870 [Sarcoptes scabiei]|uniref:Uncharacterized protein n=1 Tax=Sarcoptes scabiei TaxID=52283 RepID=A0A131ZYJ4_SARSC|nr:hypothetical protein QR98_0021870 [Sarcoptes scabiei]
MDLKSVRIRNKIIIKVPLIMTRIQINERMKKMIKNIETIRNKRTKKITIKMIIIKRRRKMKNKIITLTKNTITNTNIKMSTKNCLTIN